MNEKPEPRDPETHAIFGAAMEVHRQLGTGFLEPVYQEALAVEFAVRSIPSSREVELPIDYKETRLACCYRADFVCFGGIIVELKALSALTGIERAQILNYLKATGHRRGLLINFGAKSLQFERFIFANARSSTDFADSADFDPNESV
jgi:GxxExxY protein